MRTVNDKYYETSDRPVKLRLCDHPSCGLPGDFRAPKDRDHLRDYFFFCLPHVREYNQSWNFFEGLSPDQVENYNRDAGVWERPSWPLGQWGLNERKLRDKAMNDIFGDNGASAQTKNTAPMPIAERDALAELELQVPVTFIQIKTQYRALVKKHHPDLNRDDAEAEEKFKTINQAFTTLRKIYEPAEIED
jgi:hypothetical protein